MPTQSPGKTMRILDEAKRHLLDRLSPKVTDKNKFHKWVEELFQDTFGQVLCLSLYIDLKNSHLDEQLVINILDKVCSSGQEGRKGYCLLIEQNQHEFLFNHLHGPKQLVDDQYVRILPLLQMIEYHFRKALALPLNHEAEVEVLDRFFRGATVKREKLGIVTQIWRGRMMNVWVGSKKELDALVATISSDSISTIARDRLGFYGYDDGFLVYVIYPKNLVTLPTYIPTTLDIHSGCHFFISIVPQDGWGQTCCLNSMHTGLKERIHEALSGLTDDFQGEALGEVEQEAIADMVHLLDESIRRVS